jgi:hypothetical protein
MTVIQRLEQLKNIIPNVKVGQRGIQNLEIRIIHMLKNERGSLALRIPHHIQQLNNIRPPTHILQNLDLALNLLLLDGLEDFDDAFGVVAHVVAFEYLGVFAAADLADYLVVFLVAPVYGEGFVVPVVAGAVDVDIGVDSGGKMRG